MLIKKVAPDVRFYLIKPAGEQPIKKTKKQSAASANSADEADKFAWAYSVAKRDANYNMRQDPTIEWFFYDWDQNYEIELFYK